MTDSDILSMTKLNLQLTGTAFDGYLSNMLIPAAKKAIGQEGITLDLDDINDCNIVVMYASYLYRRRADSEAGMPRMLRYALNNRLFSEKAKSLATDSDSSGSES